MRLAAFACSGKSKCTATTSEGFIQNTELKVLIHRNISSCGCRLKAKTRGLERNLDANDLALWWLRNRHWWALHDHQISITDDLTQPQLTRASASDFPSRLVLPLKGKKNACFWKKIEHVFIYSTCFVISTKYTMFSAFTDGPWLLAQFGSNEWSSVIIPQSWWFRNI